MNRVILVGRLTKSPELKFTPNNGVAVIRLNLAVDKYNSKTGEKEADFINVVLWDKNAENTANYTDKGRLVGISGRIQTRSCDGQDGAKRFITEVVGDEIKFYSRVDKEKINDSAIEEVPFDENTDIPF